MSKGSLFHPNFFLIKFISSSPIGAPWLEDFPSLLGEPNPIFVLHAINEGLGSLIDSLIALSISLEECPLHSIVCQLLALKRRIWSSEVDKEIGPSIDIPLSSNKTINFINVGRLEDQKDHETLINGFIKLKSENHFLINLKCLLIIYTYYHT